MSAKHLQKIFEKFMCPFRFIYTHLLIQVVFNTNSDLNNICEFNSSSLFQCNMGEVLQQMSGYMNFNDHLHSISPPPPPPHFLLGGNLQSKILKREEDQEKNECLVILKSLCHRYLPRGIYVFCQKKPL